jgi:hypothetical protein
MKPLLIAAALLVGAATSAQSCELWGQKVRVIKKTSSGRSGYDAILVKGRGGVFFVLSKKGSKFCR